MLAAVGKWLGAALLLVALAALLNTAVPALSGHVAMGLAATLLFLALYATESLGVSTTE